jgi:hypothetical protein
VVLLEFLRAQDFRVRNVSAMLLSCAADAMLDEDPGFKDLEGVVAYMHGWDRDECCLASPHLSRHCPARRISPSTTPPCAVLPPVAAPRLHSSSSRRAALPNGPKACYSAVCVARELLHLWRPHLLVRFSGA